MHQNDMRKKYKHRLWTEVLKTMEIYIIFIIPIESNDFNEKFLSITFKDIICGLANGLAGKSAWCQI